MIDPIGRLYVDAPITAYMHPRTLTFMNSFSQAVMPRFVDKH